MIALETDHYRLTVDPDLGATILTADWRDGDDWLPILEPLVTPEAGLKAGCFVMAPFANRIDHGRFAFDGQSFQLPINNPAEDMAIHGFARNREWLVAEHRPDFARLVLLLNEPDLPWRFELVQEIAIEADGITVTLTMTNFGDSAMPFGFGLHPWFPKPRQTRLAFEAIGAHVKDARGLPLPQTQPVAGMSAADQQPLDLLPRLDASFAGWQDRRAVLRWPGHEVELTATGALRHLHVFNPDDRAVFCVEPVSHLPDAVNRLELGEDAQMTVLMPGEHLQGGMHLTARRT